MIEVVVGILFNEKKEILIAKRQPHQHLGDCWEFPGGKVESGEAPFHALQREFQEEVGIQVLESKPWLVFSHDYVIKKVNLNVYQITSFSGEPQGREGQMIHFATISELRNLPFPPANQAIIEALGQISF